MENKKQSSKLRKKRLFCAVIITAGVLLILYVLAYLVLPQISFESYRAGAATTGGTKIFYDESSLTEEQLDGYNELVTDIYYTSGGVETLITDGRFYEAGGSPAVMFAKYIEAIKNGDHKAYAECFSGKYDHQNGIDRFASGENEFPPQRLYDIKIEELDTLYDEESGLTLGLFSVSYRIYLNTGDFRNDITDDTAPLIFATEQVGDVVKITNIVYRYGN